MRRLVSLTFLLMLAAPGVAQGSMPLSCGCGAPLTPHPWGMNLYIGQSWTNADCFTDASGSKCRVIGTIGLVTNSWSSPVWGTFHFNGVGGTKYTSQWGLPVQNLSNPGTNTVTTYTHPSGSGTETVCDQPGAGVASFLYLYGDVVDFIGTVTPTQLLGHTLWTCEEF